MSRAILMGRLIRDPEVRYPWGERSMAIARYTPAVDRRRRRGQDSSTEQRTAGSVNYVAFDHATGFAEEYFRQGIRVFVSGRIQIDSYVNKEGQKVYTTKVISDDQEFTGNEDAASKVRRYAQAAPSQRSVPTSAIGDGLVNIPDGAGDEGLPFNQDVPRLIIKEDNTNGIQ